MFHDLDCERLSGFNRPKRRRYDVGGCGCRRMVALPRSRSMPVRGGAPSCSSSRRTISTARCSSSCRGDAHALADMVRIDRAQLRAVAGDSEQAQAVKVVARAHQTLIWERTRATVRLRTAAALWICCSGRVLQRATRRVRPEGPAPTPHARRACRSGRTGGSLMRSTTETAYAVGASGFRRSPSSSRSRPARTRPDVFRVYSGTSDKRLLLVAANGIFAIKKQNDPGPRWCWSGAGSWRVAGPGFEPG
jgi:Transposase